MKFYKTVSLFKFSYIYMQKLCSVFKWVSNLSWNQATIPYSAKNYCFWRNAHKRINKELVCRPFVPFVFISCPIFHKYIPVFPSTRNPCALSMRNKLLKRVNQYMFLDKFMLDYLQIVSTHVFAHLFNSIYPLRYFPTNNKVWCFFHYISHAVLFHFDLRNDSFFSIYNTKKCFIHTIVEYIYHC